MTEEPAEVQRIKRFISAFAVGISLRQRAWARACFIEYTLLSWAQIDAMLRWGLVLKQQIDDRSSVADPTLIEGRQRERDYISMARKEGVIDDGLANELHRLYKARNEIVHTFFITDIDYEASKRIASQLEPIIHRLTQTLEALENEQIDQGVGMTRAGTSDELRKEFEEYLETYAQEKLGDTPEKLDSVREHMWPDVEDIIDFAVRKGLLANERSKGNEG
jgi:uncharacterized protein YutE (UPF0331/DUF86 family)